MKKTLFSFAVMMFLPMLVLSVDAAQNNVPQWQREMNDRAKELEQLQKQNGYGTEYVRHTDFPKTVQDLSFSARQQLEKESVEPYKNLKAYQELNVKTAEEWCEDGDHKNSRECWEWRCGPKGKDVDKSECISYRCQKDDYYKTHTEECEKNKLCKDNNSTKCMQYRCYKTSDKDTNECKEWKCKNDSVFRTANNTMCLQFACKIDNFLTTTDECKTFLCGECGENPTGKYASRSECIRYFCNSCEEYKTIHEQQCAVAGQGCASDAEHAVTAEWDSNGQCIITECESGWKPNDTKTQCEPESHYYTLAIFSIQSKKRDWDTNETIEFGSTYGMKDSKRPCFAVCGYHYGNDDVNTKVLKPILNNNYCVQHYEELDTNPQRFIMVDQDNGYEKISFPYNTYLKIRDGLVSLQNKHFCDWHSEKVKAIIMKCQYKSDECEISDRIMLDE